MHTDSLKARHDSFAHHSASHLPDREPAVPSSTLHFPPLAPFLAGRWLVSPTIGYSSGGNSGQTAGYGGLSLGFIW